MPPAFVQSKGGTSNTLSSLPISFTSNNTAGNLLVCSGVVSASGIAGLTITDTQGNTWTIALVDNWKPLSTFFMAYAPNCKAGANTVTIAQLGSLISGAVSEYSGVSTVAPLDKAGFSDSGLGTWTAATSGNVTTRENGELIVAAQANSTGPASVTLGSGFSNLQNDSGNFVSIESQVQASAGAIAGTFTVSASSGACGVLTFVPVSDAVPFNVWTPEGNVIANTLAGGSNKLSNPNVIYDTNPVILTGNTNVFKCWACVANGSGTPTGVYYFESVDGLTSWTAYAGNPVSTGTLPKIYKNAGTYYLYTGGINVQTSTDGVTFGAVHNTGLPTGGSSDWNNTIFQLQPFDEIGGVFYGMYNGENHLGGPLTGMGIATSTDLLNWTGYASNPVANWHTTNWTFLPNKVNGFYYAYTDGVNPGSAQNFYGAIYRASSPTPTGPWTQLEYQGVPTSVFYPTTITDAVTYARPTSLGDPSICVANGNVYLYYSAGIISGNPAQINAAIARGYTAAQLVSTYEGVVGVPISGAPQLNLTTLASDSGVGTNQNPLTGNWTHVDSTRIAQRISNMFAPASAGGAGVNFWNPISWSNNQWGQIACQVCNSNSQNGVAVRQSITGATTYYKGFYESTALGVGGLCQISKAVSGTGTTLITVEGITIDVGDTILVAVNGTGLYLFWNGTIIGGTTDSSITSGSSGFAVSSNTINATDGEVNNWLGGTFQDALLALASISGNAGVGGATITYSGAASGSVTADSFGNYLLSNLPNGSYTITPSLSGYTFSPTSSNQILSGTNITGVNFVATQQSSTTAGPSSGLQSVQLYGRLANGSIVAVSVDINGNLAVSGGTGGAINSVDVLKNGVATPAMVYGVTSAGKLVAVAVDANGNLCCANVGAGGGNSSTTVDIAKYATPTPVQAVGREPISGKLYAVPLNASNSLYDSVHPGATPTSSLTVPGVAPRPVQLCGRAPNGKIIAVALDTSGRLCISGSGQSGSANAVDAFKNGVPLAIQLFGINSAGKLQPVPLDANGNLELS